MCPRPPPTLCLKSRFATVFVLWSERERERRWKEGGIFNTPQQRREKMCKQRGYHRVHTEWQWPLSGVHFVMMEKSAQPGEGVGCTAAPFHYIYHHVQRYSVQWYAEGRNTPPISTLLCGGYCILYVFLCCNSFKIDFSFPFLGTRS